MDKQTFLEQLGEKLLAHGISKEDVDNQISRFEKYFSKMGDAEARSQIDSLEDMDALAENICELLNPTVEPENHASADTGEVPVQAAEEQYVSDENESTDDATEEPEAILADDDDDMIIAPDAEKASALDGAMLSDEVLNADTVNFDRVEFSSPAKSDAESDDESLLIAQTISFEAVKTDTDDDDGVHPDPVIFADLSSASNKDDSFEDDDIFDDDIKIVGEVHDTLKFEKVDSAAEAEAPSTEAAPEKRGLFDKLKLKKKSVPVEEAETDIFAAFPADTGVVGATAETDVPKPHKAAAGLKENAPLFWTFAVLTLPITLTIALVFLSLVALGFIAIATLTGALFVLVGAVVVVGSFFSLFGIVFGIIQLFTVVPAGIYEIGIGVIIAGITMLIGVLIYNAAIRLMPIVMKRYSAFAKSLLKKAWNHLVDLKKECIG